MVTTANHTSLVKNTTHKVVIPFYVYAALSFLAATILLCLSTSAFTQHYFQPQALAITHIMALGWGTMIILGASYQLVPVLIEANLYSNILAYTSFVLAGIGIPLLVYAFLYFQFNWIAHTGAIFINAAVVSFVLNIAFSILRNNRKNVHAVFILTAAVWLLATTVVGLLLVYNFTQPIFYKGSLHYLTLHAHLGIIGWFLLLVMGVGSRLIPMFLISKYDAPRKLWWIYFLVNGSLISFIVFFIFSLSVVFYTLPVLLLLTAFALFGRYCQKAYSQRIRKQVDKQMQISLLSVGMMVLPFVLLIALVVLLLFSFTNVRLVLAYGFSIFFGWLTAIILGMTFKTLPFIVWNKVYHDKAALGKTINPKDLFSSKLFRGMGMAYLAGFVLFAVGILCSNSISLQIGTILFLITSASYNFNIIKMLMHKPVIK